MDHSPFKLFDELFEMAGRVMNSLKADSVHVLTTNELTVAVHSGNVEIRGPLNELKINGKVVRFPRGKP